MHKWKPRQSASWPVEINEQGFLHAGDQISQVRSDLPAQPALPPRAVMLPGAIAASSFTSSQRQCLVRFPGLPVYALSPVCRYLFCRRWYRLFQWSGLRIRKPGAAEELLRVRLVEPVLLRFIGSDDRVAEGAGVGTGML
jgi:hypothetical protein